MTLTIDTIEIEKKARGELIEIVLDTENCIMMLEYLPENENIRRKINEGFLKYQRWRVKYKELLGEDMIKKADFTIELHTNYDSIKSCPILTEI